MINDYKWKASPESNNEKNRRRNHENFNSDAKFSNS